MTEKLALNLESDPEPIYYAEDPFASPKENEALDTDIDDVEGLLKSLFDDADEDEDEVLSLENEAEAAFDLEDEDEGEATFNLEEEDKTDEEKVEVVEPEPFDPQTAFDFLESDDLLPGAKIVLVKEEVEPERETSWEDDQDHAKFIIHIVDRMKLIPEHSGQTTVGCEKAISYLRKLDKEISRAIQSDEGNAINEVQAEHLRDKIHKYVDLLDDALVKLVSKKRRRNRKASFSLGKKVVARLNDGADVQYFVSIFSSNNEERLFKVEMETPTDSQVQAFMKGNDKSLTKEAGNLVTFIDPFLQSITRLLITSHITQGKNIMDVYAQLDDQYTFTEREQLSIHEILMQKGLPLNIDMGRLQEKNPTSVDGKNIEYSTEYYA